MMKLRNASVPVRVALGLLAGVFLAETARAQALKVEAELIWGTNDPKSPDPTHKAIETSLAKRLGNSPYRWKNYFEVNRLVVDVPVSVTKSNLPISKQCELDIKNMGDNRVEVTLHGNGKRVYSHKESLANGWQLILSGDAKNDTAWLVVIKKLDAGGSKSEKPVTNIIPAPAPAPASELK